MPDEQDVKEESSASDATTQMQDTGAETVTQQAGDERPAKNYMAEYNRKMTKVERQQAEIAQRLDALAQLMIQQQTPVSQAQSPGQDTEEQLWSRAQAGDRLAFDEYMVRKARREVQQDRSVSNRAQMVASQMAALMQKYPVLNDGSHPLTQTAQAAYQLLLRSGYPANQETLLEAAKTAIADRPDLVSDLYTQGTQAREGARRSSTSVAQAGQTGTSVRQDSAQPKNAVIMRPGEAEIARRMGIKDPQKAKERFLQRQKDGQSALGAVSGFVREDEF
jgi:hypothetical protein